MEIPEELFSDVYSRVIDLSWQDIDVDVSGITSLSLMPRFMIHESVPTAFFSFFFFISIYPLLMLSCLQIETGQIK